MLFQYIVVANDGKEQKGRIEANSKEEATEKLNQMGLSVISVDIIDNTQKEVKSNLRIFSFFGKDNEKQEIDGTIESKDEISAYKRLIEEFGIEIKWIIDNSLPKVIAEAKKKTSVKEIEELAYEKGITFNKNKLKNDERIKEANEIIFDDNFYEKQKKIHKNIDTITKITSTFIKYIPSNIASDLDQKIDILQKIKMSNNLQFIQKSSDELIKKILFFFEKHGELQSKFEQELIEIRACLTNEITTKVEKTFYSLLSNILNKIKSVFKRISSKGEMPEFELKEEEKILIRQKFEQKEILKLILLHLCKFFITKGELRQKHKEAFLNLWDKRKRNEFSIRKIKEGLERIKNFEKKDYSFIIDEIQYFSGWLFIMYILFFALAEISILKSRIFPIDFVWKIFNSEMVIAIVFLLFLTLLFSSLIKRKFSESILTIIFTYFVIILVSILFYFNY